MEPFVKEGGGVGRDIKVWRDLSDHADEQTMDREIAQSCQFIKGLFNR